MSHLKGEDDIKRKLAKEQKEKKRGKRNYRNRHKKKNRLLKK
jgi:hypothetical protein